MRAYETSAERKVIKIEGFSIPRFLGCDDELFAIAMSIVEPPFLLDFGGAYDELSLPVFPENVCAEWHEQKQEGFSSDWRIVENVLSALRLYDIYKIDIHPRNIVFREPTT